MKTSKLTIDREVEHILAALKEMTVDSKEYEIAAKNLKELCEARSKRASRVIEPEWILMAITNVLGILFVLNFEQLHVISTKAIGLVRRV